MRRIKGRTVKDDTLAGFLFALPWLTGFFVFSAIPILMSAYYSCTVFNAITTPAWVGLKNYESLFSDPLFYKALSNTLVYTALSVPISILLSLLIASLLNANRLMNGFFRSMFFLPSIVPVVASIMIWVWIFDPTNGYLNHVLGWFGIEPINWLGNPAYTKLSLVIITLWGVGVIIVIFMASMKDVSRSLYEAASIDGAGAVSQFLYITVPSIAHVIVYQVILAIINAFQYFTQAYVIITAQSGTMVIGMAGGPKNSLLMYPLYLFYNAFTRLEMGKAAAMAWMLFVIVGILTIIITKVSSRWTNF